MQKDAHCQESFLRKKAKTCLVNMNLSLITTQRPQKSLQEFFYAAPNNKFIEWGIPYNEYQSEFISVFLGQRCVGSGLDYACFCEFMLTIITDITWYISRFSIVKCPVIPFIFVALMILMML